MQPDGNPAPGPVPDTWEPGTWTTTLTKGVATTRSYIKVNGVCEGPFAPSFQAASVTTIAGPCWGLYRITTAGECAGYQEVETWTAVIGNGFSYWLMLDRAGSGNQGIDYERDISYVNVFTPI
jgi:hypothetical protein